MILEEYSGNSWQWAVTLRGSDKAAVSDRAEEICTETRDMMTAYMSASREGVHEIQMEFTKMEGAA